MLKRIDEHAARVAKETGIAVSRSDVLRLMVERGLEVTEKKR